MQKTDARYGLVLLGLLMAAPAYAQSNAAFPIFEKNYMAHHEALFKKADVNNDGMLDAQEYKTAFDDSSLIYVSAATQTRCAQDGYALTPDARPQIAPNLQLGDVKKTITKKEMMALHLASFQLYDLERDHVVTQEEADRADKKLRAFCMTMPKNNNDRHDALVKNWQQRQKYPNGLDLEKLKTQQPQLLKELQKR